MYKKINKILSRPIGARREVKRMFKIIRKPIGRREVVHEPVQVLEPIRKRIGKRGRPKKIEKPIVQESEPLHEKQYNQAEQEILRSHLRKTKQIMKIYSAKSLMSNMHMIKKYVDNSCEFGTLSLPFPPSIKTIEREIMQYLK